MHVGPQRLARSLSLHPTAPSSPAMVSYQDEFQLDCEEQLSEEREWQIAAPDRCSQDQGRLRTLLSIEGHVACHPFFNTVQKGYMSPKDRDETLEYMYQVSPRDNRAICGSTARTHHLRHSVLRSVYSTGLFSLCTSTYAAAVQRRLDGAISDRRQLPRSLFGAKCNRATRTARYCFGMHSNGSEGQWRRIISSRNCKDWMYALQTSKGGLQENTRHLGQLLFGGKLESYMCLASFLHRITRRRSGLV